MKESKLFYLVAVSFALLVSGASARAQELQPVIAPPGPGTFYFVQHKNIPPFPFDPFFGQLPVYEVLPGIYMVDDSQVDYSGLQSGGEMSTMSDGGPVPCNPCAEPDTNTIPCITITNFSLAYQSFTSLWLKVTVDTNYVGNLVVYTSDTNATYDLFGTTNMAPLALPALSQTNWAFLMRTTTRPTNFLWTSISTCQTYFQLGTMLDDDLDGLTTAYEVLVSHTKSGAGDGWDTDGDGIPDGWEVTNGLNPLANDANSDPDGDGLTNLQEYFGGTNPYSADNFGLFLVVPKSGSLLP